MTILPFSAVSIRKVLLSINAFPAFRKLHRIALLACLAATWLASFSNAFAEQTSFKFDFGSTPAKPGWTKVHADTIYSKAAGHGFETGATLSATNGCITSDKPFYFSVTLPEGNYKVTVTLGDAGKDSTATIKAEARRLMLENIHTAAGKIETRTFAVNIRTPKIAGGGEIQVSKRESEGPLNSQWDEKLTLEFNGSRPCLRSLEIVKANDMITVFLAGDSTVTDQAREPWCGWGQMLPRFFDDGVAVANYAESGRALSSFKAQKRLEKILSVIKPGDYVLIQFGHNDQKEKGEGVGAFTTYKKSLEEYISEIRKRGGIPVLITSMNRRRFGPDGKIVETLGDYPEAVRQTAKEKGTPLIDLHPMSRFLYEAMGPENSKKAFVHYPAGTFPGQEKELKDDTHFNAYGGYELARCVVEGIKKNVPDLARHLLKELPPFDPSRPDPMESFNIPASPTAGEVEKPAGS